MSISSTCSPVVQLILQFIKTGNKQAASTPGFGHALKLSYNLISKKHLTWTDADTGPGTNSDTNGTLTYRYKFTDNVGRPTSGLLLAIMDELTTDACFGAGKPSAPGVSLQMHLELCQGMKHPERLSEVRHLQELDVVSTVVKLGRTISYTKTDFINPINQELVAFGSHVKYMPTGNVIMDVVFNQRWAWDLYCKLFLCSNSQLPIEYEEKDLYKSVIAPNLEHKGIGQATFRMNHEHVNPFGGLHGGCQAILMEIVGESLAKEQLKSSSSTTMPEMEEVVLESMSIDYVSAGRSGVLTIEAIPITLTQMHVTLYSEHGRIISVGRLVWSTGVITSKL